MGDKKKKAKKKFKGIERSGRSAIFIKEGEIPDSKVCGNPVVVTFLIGAGFGRGLCNLGPLDEDGHDLQIFEDDGDDDDDAWKVLKLTRDGEGIKTREFEKKKKAK